MYIALSAVEEEDKVSFPANVANVAWSHILINDVRDQAEPILYLVDVAQFPPPVKLVRRIQKHVDADGTCVIFLNHMPEWIGELEEDEKRWLNEVAVSANDFLEIFKPGSPGLPMPRAVIHWSEVTSM